MQHKCKRDHKNIGVYFECPNETGGYASTLSFCDHKEKFNTKRYSERISLKLNYFEPVIL